MSSLRVIPSETEHDDMKGVCECRRVSGRDREWETEQKDASPYGSYNPAGQQRARLGL
jgi:hypothetical protein